jgi:hypothetical protein
MSKRAGSTVVEVAGSHAIYVSQPNAVATLIEEAATGLKAGANWTLGECRQLAAPPPAAAETLGPSSTGSERRYAPAEATVVIGKSV